ncbi:MAG: hypothetical protein ACI3VU_02995 [Faecousia sp.]
MLEVLSFLLLWLVRLILLGIVLWILAIALYVILKLVNFIKCVYVRLRIEHIQKIELYPQVQQYRKVYEEAGYSHAYRWGSFRKYYRAKTVPAGKAGKVKVRFESGATLSIILKETSRLYRMLLSRCE